MIEVWTDGSSYQGEGGWAWAAPDGRFASGYEQGTTNQRMELRAALQAALDVQEPGMVIVSDSAYVVNCFKEGWHVGWARNGWRNYARKPVANQDLWEPMIEIVEVLQVGFRKVRGHTGDPMNEVVDKLCGAARVNQLDAAGVMPMPTVS